MALLPVGGGATGDNDPQYFRDGCALSKRNFVGRWLTQIKRNNTDFKEKIRHEPLIDTDKR